MPRNEASRATTATTPAAAARSTPPLRSARGQHGPVAPPARPARAPGQRASALALSLAGTGIACALLLWTGWLARDEYWIVARSGVGYALGIAGLAMMALLLLYSLRKRIRALRNLGSLRGWFLVHMMLGLLGPTAILLHANFQLGSRNSTVALVSMLLVAGSGIAGRFIYTRIHHEYHGRRATLAEIRAAAQDGRGALGALAQHSPELIRTLRELESRLLTPSSGRVQGAWRFLRAGGIERAAVRRAWRSVRPLLTAQRRGADRLGLHPRAARRALEQYGAAVRRVARFSGYERAFAIWHVLHLPLCVLLFATAAVHVLAVHVY
ncbi:MAG: hypothetical protein OEM49_02350 [Myxococcales bacterium]|nr:hypothetical protein [Myxococcales bacterium]MDH5306703.1 hypothetical protein [Myxococcales bacterium]MDH5565415.1 hypothetical protein [Myxococcales bacterium]